MIHCLFRFKVPRESFLLVLLLYWTAGFPQLPPKAAITSLFSQVSRT